MNNNDINTSVKQQLIKNYPFLRKSVVYNIVDELKTVNSKIRLYIKNKKDILKSNEITKENYKTNPYIIRLKTLANFKKKPVQFKLFNYTFPKDYKVFEEDKIKQLPDAFNKTELYNTLEKIYTNYDKLYSPFQSKTLLNIRYFFCIKVLL